MTKPTLKQPSYQDLLTQKANVNEFYDGLKNLDNTKDKTLKKIEAIKKKGSKLQNELDELNAMTSIQIAELSFDDFNKREKRIKDIEQELENIPAYIDGQKKIINTTIRDTERESRDSLKGAKEGLSRMIFESQSDAVRDAVEVLVNAYAIKCRTNESFHFEFYSLIGSPSKFFGDFCNELGKSLILQICEDGDVSFKDADRFFFTKRFFEQHPELNEFQDSI
jgi:hypothetical protein